jgi:hypothetical protein
MEKNTPAAPNYWPKLLRLYASVPFAVGLNHIQVLHDDWCALLRQGGCCDCDPVIRVLDPKAHWRTTQSAK